MSKSTPESQLAATFVPSDDRASQKNTSGTAADTDPASATPPMSSGPQKKKKTKKPSGKTVNQLGDFKLKKKLGQGGMGVVYMAKQIKLDRIVALKTLSRDLAKRKNFVKRFVREARSMAKLDHENVVKVYDVDCQNGIYYAAIEYVDGKSAQDWLDQLGKFSVGDALNITLAATLGLKAAHDQGMVHRDIKPDNLLITSKGITKVADFGLAKALDDEDNSVTQTGAGLGTPLYMAPEQARSAKYVDHRSDIYALGATLYHMVTGELPFMADSALELILAKESGKFTPARSINPDVPERLSLMIEKMLAKEPDHRYASCDEILNDLSSLSLATFALSFIDNAQPALPAVARAGAQTMVAKSQSTPARSGLNVTSKIDAERQDRAKQIEKVWYVQHYDEAGKKTLSKMSTAQIILSIRKEIVTAKSRIKTDADADWRPLSDFQEFKADIEKSLIKQQAKEKKSNLSDLYKQVDKAEKNRHRWRFLRNIKEATVAYANFIIYLVIIAVVIAAIMLYSKDLMSWGGRKLEALGLGDGVERPEGAEPNEGDGE